ncbi:MAG: UDP-N-acetylglucosamine--N-acetylmuramyl-(pentapeptide) pyrophosphoryl-undecaprenol N-acetylglucosamine transferase, partial [Candidatus Promineifilaceae bacterium]|nr:UDP-N-acetylglucosamine--N-acetylmuramyl-(pentapeptide) pyrophosphoryl-undecaprenol N-acetylglucosamine transferase [Candidatus Promineifilaceae bacterium]
TGGYINAPVALAAWLRRVPAAIYLPDIEPGMAIRWLSRFARRVACTAAPSARYFAAGKAVVTGYPVRPEIRNAAAVFKTDALTAFELEPGDPTALVFGGSRGARSINRALLAQLPSLLSETRIIHISGTLDWPEVEAQAATLPVDMRARYRPYAYLHERMGLAFRAADLVVARAGASMLGEAPAFGLPSVLVPYPHAWRYQKINADYLAGRGAAIRLDDHRLMDALAETIVGLLNEPRRLQQMSEAARQLDTPTAAARLAELLTDLGRGKRR